MTIVNSLYTLYDFVERNPLLNILISDLNSDDPDL